MMVIPAVDIKNGKCVQLVQGKPGTEQVILEDPAKIARQWEDRGARMIHVIDLGGALGESKNLEIVREILDSVSIPIQMGGGIRTKEDALNLLDMGIDKVILGTVAMENHGVVKDLSNSFGKERILVALDSKDSQVVVRGWTEKTDRTAPEMGKIFERLGAGGILFTNVDYEGLMKGFSLKPLEELLKAVHMPVIYSGGVSTLEDVEQLSKTRVKGVVIGSALYKGNIKFEKALEYE
ncbi:1-(5-phosphoribosyl)-5-[(5-phosphoribosylamino)methylideneamino]imidazole-4-carboxamide isomerase [Methanobacterium sp. CWC-01]|uniref:1-(5-phosphoribosyl)-5-[(5- phosphoribosylamino)methylideneamino]imidazole-4- carboxamide isomerase n=1 Tax=Methanobacterium aridiramus TaxID=2584467 RepID=UPI0025749864|nr:1-(5-phosphoribosyl)-5-[(5-phosphoribosylamino)methylideneamino]imidazole-4-carboxamide isomerase [Methanobacterium sp. CWC-01]WJI08884.1 1-(5-phosphoribosyl)-5-[(5-phosphoribosylamino)methylideneamino]imidazole-4-carboxamide isomerase [Methanobacterium sp. CWC-01]